MSRSILNAKAFQSEKAAYEWLENRIWPEGPVCPHCGGFERIGKMKGSATRFGLYKCYQCRKQFRATVGTVFEKSHVPMTLWLQAMYLLASSKKGVSSNQLHRALGVTLKTAWFMSHRLRLAMAQVGLTPLGGDGKSVEADETYMGHKEGVAPKLTKRGKPGLSHKRAILALVERGGSVRSFHLAAVGSNAVTRIVNENIARESRLLTDESRLYAAASGNFASHESVHHTSGEYVRGDVHTNTVEGVFSVFKRGMKGIYQHCAEKHLHRYLVDRF
jgi:transposase-like protein